MANRKRNIQMKIWITEEAHEIGMQLANEILGGKYEFVLTTHIDKGHIHNHLIFNSVSFASGVFLRACKAVIFSEVCARSSRSFSIFVMVHFPFYSIIKSAYRFR